MSARIPHDIREMLKREAYILSLQHFSQGQIAELLGTQYGIPLSRQAINGLIKEQRKGALALLDRDVVEALAEYIGKNDAVEHDAWQRLGQAKANAQNVPGLQHNILVAAKNTATALGVLTDWRVEKLEAEVEVKATHKLDLTAYAILMDPTRPTEERLAAARRMRLLGPDDGSDSVYDVDPES
jgi:hypothetical protein